MKEIDRNEKDLEERLRDHYQRRYEQPPALGTIWVYIQPQLDEQQEKASTFAQRARRLSALASLFAARQKAAFTQRQEDLDTKVNEAETADPHFTQNKQSLHRRLRHTLEAAIAVLMVASLLLGWFAVTRSHIGQGTEPSLFSYTSQPGESVYDFQWTPDKKYLTFVLYQQKTNRFRFLVWNVALGKVTQTVTSSFKYDDGVSAGDPHENLTDSYDGRYMLIDGSGTAKREWVVKLINVLTGQVKQIYDGIYPASGHPVFSLVSFSHDSKYVAFGEADGSIGVWDIAAGKIILTMNPTKISGVVEIAWSADDKRILFENVPILREKPITLQVWNARTGHKLLNIVETPTMSLFQEPLQKLLGGLSPDGTRIITYNTKAGTFEVRESSTLKVLHTFHIQLHFTSQTNVVIIYTVFWLADGARIFLEGDQAAYIWNAATDQPVLTLPLKNTSQAPSSATPDWGGRYIVRWQGNLLEIWDVNTGVKVKTISLATRPQQVYWTLDNRYLTVTYQGKQGQLYDTLTGSLLVTYQGDSAILSPDGRYVATTNNLSDPKTGNALKCIVQVLYIS